MSVEFTDNSRAVLDALQSAAAQGLEQCGLAAEGYAKKLAPVDTGNLRNSIGHKVDPDGQTVYIGTNAEYAAYVIREIITGRQATRRSLTLRPPSKTTPTSTARYWNRS